MKGKICALNSFILLSKKIYILLILQFKRFYSNMLVCLKIIYIFFLHLFVGGVHKVSGWAALYEELFTSTHTKKHWS